MFWVTPREMLSARLRCRRLAFLGCLGKGAGVSSSSSSSSLSSSSSWLPSSLSPSGSSDIKPARLNPDGFLRFACQFSIFCPAEYENAYTDKLFRNFYTT